MKDFTSITFEDFINNGKVLKEQYTCLLVPFFDIEAIRCWKKMVYSLPIRDWQKNLIWEMLNDDIEVEQVKLIIEKNNKKKSKN